MSCICRGYIIIAQFLTVPQTSLIFETHMAVLSVIQSCGVIKYKQIYPDRNVYVKNCLKFSSGEAIFILILLTRVTELQLLLNVYILLNLDRTYICKQKT